MEEGAFTEKQVILAQESDITVACLYGRTLAIQLGLSLVEQMAVVTAIKEIGYNIIKYAGRGQLLLSATRLNDLPGLVIVARDEGPGIVDVAQAMQEGYSTGKGLGLGLPGARRLMDEFEIESRIGQGTTIVMKKWLKQHSTKR